MTHTHTQCRLHRHGAIQVSWLPTEFARKGHYVRLKENGEWTDGWQVAEVFPGQMASKIVQERSRDYKSHRDGTDI